MHSLQEVIAPVFAAKRRKLAFYLDPSTAADQFVAQLEHGSFVFEPEVWLVAERDSLKQRPQSPVTVVPVNERNEADFLRVFSVAFGGPSTAKDGYGDIPPEYLSALRLSFSGQQTLAGVRHSHFIAYKGSTPVGCASIHHDGEFAGLYNVGTLAEARGSGIGSALSLHAMTLAFENGVTQVFLQTQSGGSVERFYQHLGCTVAFQAAIAHKA